MFVAASFAFAGNASYAHLLRAATVRVLLEQEDDVLDMLSQTDTPFARPGLEGKIVRGVVTTKELRQRVRLHLSEKAQLGFEGVVGLHLALSFPVKVLSSFSFVICFCHHSL